MLIIILIIFSKSMTFGNFSHNFTLKSLSPLKRTKQYRRIKKKFGGQTVEKIVAIFQGKLPARGYLFLIRFTA